jgi:hypothetical protein
MDMLCLKGMDYISKLEKPDIIVFLDGDYPIIQKN